MTIASPSGSRSTFEHALIAAITEGRAPDHGVVLTACLRSAIEAIAVEHPEAAIDLINAAYDTYQAEYGVAG